MGLKIVILILLFVKQILTETCYTPEKEEGQCVPLNSCPKLIDEFANPLRGSETYLQKFICNKDKEIKVCCGLETEFSVLAEQHSVNNPSQIPFSDIFFNYKVRSLSNITLPVIVAKHLGSDEEVTRCVGAFFNPRYVLTSADCVTFKTGAFAVVGVRLPVRENDYFIGVEEVIPHLFYDKVTGINDLALLRLNDTISEGQVAFLPISRFWQAHDSIQDITAFVGLNASAVAERHNKTSVTVDSLSMKECESALKSKNSRVVLTSYDRCSKKIKRTGEVSCNSYAGVPLAFDYIGFKSFKGISSSRTSCDDNLPDVYTNVVRYVPWIMNNMRPWAHNNDHCTTPDGKEGHCVSVFYCLSLLEMFVAARRDTQDYLRTFICKERETPKDEFFVCCPPSADFTSINNIDLKSSDLPPEFLEKERCGLQHRDDYFSSSNEIAVDEYPWIALVERKSYFCNGILINARYVLTTAYCTFPTDYTEITVHLGDYHISNGTDCVEDPDVKESDCIKTVQYGVEAKIEHPFYIYTHSVVLNNIGLLRLNRMVVYTDFIRPICLHTIEDTATVKPGDALYRSSWITFASADQDLIKTKIPVKMITTDECHRNVHQTQVKDFVNFATICTTDLDSKLSSRADKGGPLMADYNYQWYLEGMYDIKHDSRFVIHLNVSKYVNWILENMSSWKK